MKQMYNFLTLVIVAFVFSFTTTSCTLDPRDKFVGRWQLVEIGESDVDGTNYVTKKRFKLDSNYSIELFENEKAVIGALPSSLNSGFKVHKDTVSWEIDLERQEIVFFDVINCFKGEDYMVLDMSPTFSPSTSISDSGNNGIDEDAVIIEFLSPLIEYSPDSPQNQRIEHYKYQKVEP